MADVKISALPAATTPLSGTEIVPIVQGGVTAQVTVGNLTAARTVAASTINVDANTSTDAVRITQTGAGNALLVEDSANPDSTPFVVTNAGFVGVNTLSPSAVLNVVGHNEFTLGFTAQSNSTQTAFLSHPVAILANVSSAAGNGLGLRYTIADSSGTGRTAGGIGTIATAKSASSVTADMYFYTGTTPTERMRITSAGNVGIGTAAAGTAAEKVLAIGTGVAPTTGPADTIQIYSTDLSAGNTMLSIYTEGTSVNANTTAATTHRIAVRINGTVYYLLANTAA